MKAPVFERVWIAADLPGVRPQSGTYGPSGYADLPPLGPRAPGLAWLVELHPKIAKAMEPHRPSDEARAEYAAARERILATAERDGVKLPPSFIELSGSPELQDRIPSCTACYFDLPTNLSASPFRNGDYILRFLNDQQVCFCWYLYLPFDAEPFVVASGGAAGETFLEDLPLDDESVRDEARAATAFTAPSFDDFLYRFWIENLIWFNVHDDLPLTAAQLAYLRHYDPAFGVAEA